MHDSSLILFAHGARDPDWARPFERLRAAISSRQPSRDVRLAFLELMNPSLEESIDEAVRVGATAVVVVPVFLAQGGHVKRDLPAMLAAARQRYPGVDIRLETAVGEAQTVIDAIAEWVIGAVDNSAHS